ncbi:hypothetical protein ACET5Y_07970 [Aeromonas veronii]
MLIYRNKKKYRDLLNYSFIFLKGYTLLVMLLTYSVVWADTITPSHLELVGPSITSSQQLEWADGSYPEVLAHQIEDSYYQLMMRSMQSSLEHPVVGRIWLEDNQSRRQMLTHANVASASDEVALPQRWIIEFKADTLASLTDGHYVLPLSVRWAQSGIVSMHLNVELSGFIKSGRIEIRAADKNWDLSSLFDPNARQTTLDVPIQICLDPASSTNAGLSINQPTELTHKNGSRQLYQLELLNDANDIRVRYLSTMFHAGKVIFLPSLTQVFGQSAREQDPCLGYILRFSGVAKTHDTSPGLYSQTLKIIISQGM